jgi:hypothetical protein
VTIASRSVLQVLLWCAPLCLVGCNCSNEGAPDSGTGGGSAGAGGGTAGAGGGTAGAGGGTAGAGGGSTGAGGGSTGAGGGSGGAGGGVAGAGGGVAGAGGGTAGAGGGSAGAGGGAAVVDRSGIVSLGQASIQTYTIGSAAADFSTTEHLTLLGCTVTFTGNCKVLSCPGGAVDAGVLVVTHQSAGPVTITGTTPSITLQPGTDGGAYVGQTFLGALWSGGETLSVSAAGAEVPAFFGQSVQAPSTITLTAPVCSLASCSQPIDRAAPLQVTWTGGVYGTVYVTVSSAPLGPVAVVQCSFPAGAGSGSIAPAMLANLPAALDGGATFSIVNMSQAYFDAGVYQVQLAAESSARQGWVVIQ